MKRNIYTVCLPAALAAVVGLAPWEPGSLAAQTLKLKDTLGGAHTEPIRELEFSPDGKTLCSAVTSRNYRGERDQLKLWNVAAGKNTFTFQNTTGLFDPRFLATYRLENKELVLASVMGHVQFRDVASGRKIAAVKVEKQKLQAPWGFGLPALGPGGKVLATRDENHIELWDTTTGKKSDSFQCRTNVHGYDWVLSPKGKYLATWGSGPLQLWDIATGQHLAALSTDPPAVASAGVRTVCFSPKETLIAVGTYPVAKTKNASQEVEYFSLCELATGKVVKTWEVPGAISAFTFTPDGTIVAVASRETIRTWDVASGASRTAIPIKRDSYVSFSPDGSLVAAQERYPPNLRVWDVATGRLLALSPGQDLRRFSPNGKKLLTWDDRTIALWEVGGVKKIASWPLQKSRRSFTFSPDSALVVGCDMENSQLWDTTTGKLVGKLQDASYFPTFSPGNQYLAFGDYNKVRLWDVKKEKLVTTLEAKARHSGHNYYWYYFFSPDGKLLVGTNGVNTQVWEVPGGKPIASFEDFYFNAQPYSVKVTPFTPDSKTLALRAGVGVKLWDVVSRKMRTFLPQAHSRSIASLTFSPDGKILATGSDDSTIKLWHTVNKKCLATLEGYTGDGGSVIFSPNGKRLASFGTNQWLRGENWPFRVWDVATGELLLTLTEDTDNRYPALAFSPDSKTVAINRVPYHYGKDNRIELWDVATGQRKAQLPTGIVTALAFSPDGRHLAAAHDNQLIKLWDVTTSTCTATWPHEGASEIFHVSFLAGGKTLAAIGEPVRVWDVANGKNTVTIQPFTFPSKSSWGRGIPRGLSQDGKTLIQYSYAGNSGTGDFPAITLWDVHGGKLQKHFKGLYSHWQRVYPSPDGRTVAQVGEGFLRVWNTATGKERFSVPHGGIWSTDFIPAFSPDSKLLACFPANAADAVCVVDMASGKEVARLQRPFRFRENFVPRLVAFSAAGKELALTDGFSVQFWPVGARDSKTLTAVQKTIEAKENLNPRQTIMALALSPDGKLMATGHNGGLLRLWDTTTGQNTTTVDSQLMIASLTFNPDGTLLVANDSTTIQLWEVVPAKQAEGAGK